MRTLKLIKLPPKTRKATGEEAAVLSEGTEASVELNAEQRFQRGLDELRAVTTFSEYQQAVERGVSFTVDGFRRRIKVGNTAMRTTHRELFSQLNDILDYIYPEILGVRRNLKGRSRNPNQKPKRRSKDDEVKRLKVQLDRMDRDCLDLLAELRILRAN
ncbi:hypothetical protein [Rhizobium sp. 9140]|uniref:hypothetical protein n=1 Tax=Rhizobium sp. 9140 TaxID=1761900 RepID=UPI0007956C6C|nr:hypothetical protein [Rhizobium sp. 9140]CZT33114.1 hypothetical protein GA0004734_00001400 [Rhizobium sp. 9140]